MFKMLPPTFFVVPVAWVTIFLLNGLNALTPIMTGFGLHPSTSWVVLVGQALFTAIFVTPLWRWIWQRVPRLNEWFYPDLNGDWDVHGATNWSRIDLLLKAANGETTLFDMRLINENQLPPLAPTLMRARITQSWLKMRIVLWNPTNVGPIKQSHTLFVEPFRGEEGCHGLAYIFEQENAAGVVSDDRVFKGSSWVVRDRDDPNVLRGHMWSDRMWRRGMNTASELRFVRRARESASA